MERVKLRVSLILVVFVLFTVFNSIGALGFFKELEKSIDNILVSNHESILAAEGMENVLEEEQEIISSYLLRENNEVEEYKKGEKDFLEFLYKSKNNITEEGEKELVGEIERDYYKYKEEIRNLKDIRKDKLIETYYKNVIPKYNELKEKLKELFYLNQEFIVKMKDKSEELAKKASYYSLTISLIIIVIGGLAIKYLLNKILNPIEDLSKGIKEVSDGNLEYKIPLKREKEINFILEEFNKMAEKLSIYERININQILKESKKSEAIIESMDSPIVVTDGNNKIIMLNKGAEILLKVDAKSVYNKHFLEGVDNRDIFNIIKKSRENLLNDEYLEEIEFREEQKYYKIIANQIVFNNRENIGTVILMQDITRFKEVDRLKTDLLNTISHEFRTPLTSISMATDMLLLNSNIEDKELLKIIKDEEENLNKLVSELLLLSKLETGKIKMNIEEEWIKDIALEVKNKFKLQLKEKNINLNINLKEEKVLCDKEKINWVLSNLVGNAIRYTENFGIIEISSEKVNEKLVIKVKDTGCGIEKEYINQIFNKFFQTGENEGSAGLGLSICKEIVKEHSGEIWAKSEISKGSEFYFTLNLFEK